MFKLAIKSNVKQKVKFSRGLQLINTYQFGTMNLKYDIYLDIKNII